MPCFHPLPAYKTLGDDGKFVIRFDVLKLPSKKGILPITPLMLPCGQCIGCRLDRSRQWAARIVHEAERSMFNCFITLTYDNEHLPPSGSLVKSDFQKFMKRFRKRFSGAKIRYYMCGEYGELHQRPHYHSIIFGFDFPDKVPLMENVRGDVLFTSSTLQELWPFGLSSIGEVTFESAAYVARYVMKKVTGPQAKEHYGDRIPEYNCMSRRPGIAYDYYQNHKTDLYDNDVDVVRDGIKLKPCRYFDTLFDLEYPEKMAEIKEARIANMPDELKHPDILERKEKFKKAQTKGLKRRFNLGGYYE